MKASTKNRVMGTYHEMKGGFKATIGSTLNSRRVAFSGRVERIGGSMQATYGRFQRFLGW